MFKALGAKTFSSDEIVEELYRKNEVKKKLAKVFGKKVFSGSRIDKKKLAKIIFSEKMERKKLERIVHALVFREIKKEIAGVGKAMPVVVEIPLLFESKKNFFSLFDFVAVVKATKKQQLERGKKSGFGRKEILERMKAQMPLEKKIKKADFVIDNSGSVSGTREQVKAIFWLLALV